MITLAQLLTLSGILFSLAMPAFSSTATNVILLLMCVELLLLAANFNFIRVLALSLGHHGQVFVFFILTVARPNRRSDSPSWCAVQGTAQHQRRDLKPLKG